MPDKIGFIGLGLIGGSIAKTIHRIYPEITLIAHDLNTDALALAEEESVISQGFSEITDDFAKCRYIFLCTPVQKNAEFLAKLSDFAGENCIITDVGSVKGSIHTLVSGTAIAPRFIGGHPMTGSEKSGYEHATPYLLENAYYILTPTSETDAASFGNLRISFALWAPSPWYSITNRTISLRRASAICRTSLPQIL